MSNPTPLPDPKKLDEAAAKINTEYEAILTQDKNMKAEGERIVGRAIAVGDMLLTVKDALGHGNWLPWLTTKCPNIPERTARRWMSLAKKKEVLAVRNEIGPRWPIRRLSKPSIFVRTLNTRKSKKPTGSGRRHWALDGGEEKAEKPKGKGTAQRKRAVANWRRRRSSIRKSSIRSRRTKPINSSKSICSTP